MTDFLNNLLKERTEPKILKPNVIIGIDNTKVSIVKDESKRVS